MNVLDVGTGGGFPGIPLAIMFPDVKFDLLDSTLKKINVVIDIAEKLKLENVIAIHSRAEAHQGNYDLIIGRAVSTLDQMVEWTNHLTTKNRWIILKGGNQKEIRILSFFYYTLMSRFVLYLPEEKERPLWQISARLIVVTSLTTCRLQTT